MKILLDENIDVRFKSLFQADMHEVSTVRDMKWNGIKNGVLLKLIQEKGFDCFVIVDKNLPYQQNLTALPFSIVVLNVFRNTLPHLTLLMPRLLETLSQITVPTLVIVEES